MEKTRLGLAFLVCFLGSVHLGFGFTPAPQDEPINQNPQVEVADAPPGARSANSFIERFLEKKTHSIGFAVGAIESYSSDFLNATTKEGGSITSLQPRIFASFRRNKSAFLLDYDFGYRRYNRDSRLNRVDHTARLTYQRRVSPNGDIHISEEFRSALNDLSFSSISPLLTTDQTSLDHELNLERQRVTSNSVSAGLSYRVSRRANIGLTGGFDFWRYGSGVFDDTRSARATVQGSYQINKYLFLDNTYTHNHYLTSANRAFGATNAIHRLEVGGLRFRSRSGSEVSGGTGLEATTVEGKRHLALSIHAAASKNFGNTLVSLSYQRGFSVIVGDGSLLKSDNIGISFSQWLSQRVSFNLGSHYNTGSSIDGRSLDYVSADAAMNFALQRHLLLSTQYAYDSQRAAKLTSSSSNLNRYTASVGIHYFLSSLSDR